MERGTRDRVLPKVHILDAIGENDGWSLGRAIGYSYLDHMRAFSFLIIILVAIVAIAGGGVAFVRRRSSDQH